MSIRKNYGRMAIPSLPAENKNSPKASGNDSAIRSLEEQIEKIRDEMTKQNRDNLDSMYNIDMDNMSETMQNLFQSFDNGIASAQAAIATFADETSAQFEAIAKYQTENSDALASLTGRVSSNESSIEILTGFKSTTTEKLASISTKADENEASISQIVSAVGRNGDVTAASIVASINSSGSNVKIASDHLEIDASIYDIYSQSINLYNSSATNYLSRINFYDNTLSSPQLIGFVGGARNLGLAIDSSYDLSIGATETLDMSGQDNIYIHTTDGLRKIIDIWVGNQNSPAAEILVSAVGEIQFSTSTTYTGEVSRATYYFCSDGIYRNSTKLV